jgi:putative heme iron utilization protein
MSDISNQELSIEIKNFLHSKDVGVLSSKKDQDGELFPYGSICPFVVLRTGEIAILVSDIALHTKNMNERENVSFTVFDMDAKKKQAAARTSILAKATRLDKDSQRYNEVADCYYSFNPESRKFFEVHNFAFYILKPVFIHYIKGFGKIYKFSADDFVFNDSIEESHYQFAIDHMNKDHKNSISKYVKDLNLTPDEPTIVNMNQLGFHVMNGDEIIYIPFKQPAEQPDDLRTFLVEMARS